MRSTTCVSRVGRSASSWCEQRRRSSALDGSQCLGVLLASHISSRLRLQYLQWCLASIAAQSRPPDVLILSWYAHGDLAEAALAMLESVRLPCRVCFLRQRAQRSQYGHLREALAAFSELRLAPAECSWLMFSDDDDLWHPRRAHLTRLACTRTSAAPIDARSAKSTRAIGFGVYAYPVDTEQPEHRARDGGTLEERLQTASAVDSALERRTAGVWLGASEVFQYLSLIHI